MSIVHDPGLGMESSKSELGGGTTPFMAPELLAPSRFGLDRCSPSKEADIYAMGMVTYQVRLVRCLVDTRVNSSPVGTHRETTVREIGWVRGGVQGHRRGEALETCQRTGAWPFR